MNRIVTNVIRTNVVSCSVLANFHQPRQRRRFSCVGSKTYPVLGAASGWPVIGLTRRGT